MGRRARRRIYSPRRPYFDLIVYFLSRAWILQPRLLGVPSCGQELFSSFAYFSVFASLDTALNHYRHRHHYRHHHHQTYKWETFALFAYRSCPILYCSHVSTAYAWHAQGALTSAPCAGRTCCRALIARSWHHKKKDFYSCHGFNTSSRDASIKKHPRGGGRRWLVRG